MFTELNLLLQLADKALVDVLPQLVQKLQLVEIVSTTLLFTMMY